MAMTIRTGLMCLAVVASAAMGALVYAQAPSAAAPATAPAADSAAAAAAAPPPAPVSPEERKAQFPFSNGSVKDGTAKAALCTACHGPNGNSTNPEWPRLAGQSAVYLAEQIRLFKSGARNNPIMKPLVASLSDKDIADISVYFEAQTASGLEADPSYWKAGQALYTRGDTKRDIPACVACHGPGGRGNLAAGYPALRAQQSVYVAKQLADYSSGARYQGAGNPAVASRNGVMMLTVAKRLSPTDMRDLASYVQGMR